MYAVQVTDLRRRLGHHLHNVQCGELITVWRGATPIARIVPYEEGGDITDGPTSAIRNSVTQADLTAATAETAPGYRRASVGRTPRQAVIPSSRGTQQICYTMCIRGG
jgi:prevent-host-death family protein